MQGQYPSMFPYYVYIGLVSPSLTGHQSNAIEFATKVCFPVFKWLRGTSTIDVVYEGEIVQCVALQKLVAHLVQI